MKVVVTGGAGFIGANLCRRLAVEPGLDEVVALDDLSTGRRENLAGLDATLVEGSILDDSILDATLAGADAVVHLGARPSVPLSVADPVPSHVVNATGTLQVLEAARRAGSPLVVVASSSSVYGANPSLPKHEGLATRPMSPYAASKLATESYALAWQYSYSLPVMAYRFFNVFGPLQPPGHAYAAVVPAFVAAALDGQAVPVHGDGRQTRDFTYVGTVAEVLTRTVTGRLTSPEPVNLAFGSRVDLLTVVDLLGELLGRSLEVEHLAPRVGDVRDSQADGSKVRALFPDLEPVSLAEGLRVTIDWMASTLDG
ncbi:MAG TPA: NAD-dependent epimerase/dehydratase family protein [Acidimicrobiales bacterium]